MFFPNSASPTGARSPIRTTHLIIESVNFCHPLCLKQDSSRVDPSWLKWAEMHDHGIDSSSEQKASVCGRPEPILKRGFCVAVLCLFHSATELSQGIGSVCTFHHVCSILQVKPTIEQSDFNFC